MPQPPASGSDPAPATAIRGRSAGSIPWFALGLAVLLALPAGVLFPYRHNGFVSDDFRFITEPLPASAAEWLLAGWEHSPGDPARYRPLVRASYALDRARGRDTPATYHWTNFLLHGASAALLALLARQISGSPGAGLLAGALFALHPITHENVLWISGRTYPLAAVFMLGTLAWLARREPQSGVGRHGIGLVLVALALGSYEGAVTLPVLVGLAALLGLVPTSSGRNRIVQAVVASLPYLALLLAYLAFRRFWLASTETPAIGAPLPTVLANLEALTERLFGCGACRYGGRVAASISFWATLALALVAAVGAWRRRETAAAFGIAMAAVAFLPFLRFVGFTDRFAYLTAAGFVLFIGVGTRAAWVSLRPAMIRAAIVAVVAATALLWTRQYWLAGNDWREAGEIADAITAQAQALVPNPLGAAVLRFYGVPLAHGVAYVYITHFGEAVQRRYGRRDLQVVFERESPDTAQAAGAGRGPGEYAFRWDTSQRRLERLGPTVQ